MFHVWHIQYTVYWHTAGYVIAFCYILYTQPATKLSISNGKETKQCKNDTNKWQSHES